ncbi:hypothetical protein LIER_35710 [Lithospermum erythrorhizon]|uniref:Uncharacterized protein n=1 Tax=Lithospermum erythrorhizon TaxID=34254 RepID=A0AAV3NVK2_LITER
MPVTDQLDAIPLPRGFTLPQFTQFNGIGDPIKHLSIDSYKKTEDAFIANFRSAIQAHQDKRALMDIQQGGGDSRNSRKNYARMEVYSFNQETNLRTEIISFFDKELIGIELPHDDPVFPTPLGIGKVCGDKKRARICYQTFVPSLNKEPSEQDRKRSRKNHMEVNTVKSEGDEDNSSKERESEKRVMPHEEVLTVPFGQENKEKKPFE